MSPTVLLYIGVGVVVLGSVGGALEKACAPEPGKAGGFGYRVGVFLASLGTDLVSLRKLGGGQ